MNDTTPDATTEPATAVTLPADFLAQLDKHTRSTTITPTEVTEADPVVVERLRGDERLVVHSLERYLDNPLRQRGAAVVHEWNDFAQLVNRLHDEDQSTMWADVDNNRVTVLFDDHGGDHVAGWRQHRAVLALQPDVDWTAWLQADGKYMGQEEFAERLEDLAHTIVEPDAATLIEVATGFRATTKAEFSRVVRLDNGNVQMSYSEQTDARSENVAGRLEIPPSFTIRIAPWRGVDPVDLTARLRYRITQGQLRLGYALGRPDRARDDAFALILRNIRDNTVEQVPLFKGVAPEPVTPPAETER